MALKDFFVKIFSIRKQGFLSDKETQRVLAEAKRLWEDHRAAQREHDINRMHERYDQVIELLLRLKNAGRIREIAGFIQDPLLRVPHKAFMRRLWNGL